MRFLVLADIDDEVHLGFEAFNHYIERAKPQILLHGHQHKTIETMVHDTRVLGVHGHIVVEATT